MGCGFMPSLSALLWDIGKGHGILGAGAAGGCEPPGVVLGTRSQVLEEQYPLLTDRPFITSVPSLRSYMKISNVLQNL